MRDIDVGKPNENVDLMFGKKHGKLYVNINLFKMATTFNYIMKQNNTFQKIRLFAGRYGTAAQSMIVNATVIYIGSISAQGN